MSLPVDPQHQSIAVGLAAELSLEGEVTRFADGSVPVFAVGSEHVLKLFPAKEEAFWATEKAALACIDGKLTLPTPRLVAAGVTEDWLYVAMTRLPGISLAQAWPKLDTGERRRLMRDVGAGLSALHAVAADAMPPFDWPGFVAAQRVSCRERQLTKQLGAPWLDGVDEFLARHTPADDGRRALLHTEVMREHLLVEPRGGLWCLSGLVDFEPAMVGAPEYDFASVGVFTTCAEPGLLREFLAGYGWMADNALPLRIMAYALLHRYSNLRWYLERLSPGDANDLESLARRWFSP